MIGSVLGPSMAFAKAVVADLPMVSRKQNGMPTGFISKSGFSPFLRADVKSNCISHESLMISTSKTSNVPFALHCSLILCLPIAFAMQTGCNSALETNTKPETNIQTSKTTTKLTSHSKMIRELMEVHKESKFDHPFLGRNKIATGEDFYQKSKRTSPPDAFRAARKLAEFDRNAIRKFTKRHGCNIPQPLCRIIVRLDREDQFQVLDRLR